MKTTNVLKAAALVALLTVSGQANAQFLKKLGKVAEKATKTVETTTKGLTETGLNANTAKSLAWDKIPVYTAKKFYVTDAAGNQVKNDDGTPKFKVLLVDQYDSIRSTKSVEAQIKVINQRVLAILAKVGVGAGLGALQNGLSGAAVGAATGAVASIDDIAMAKKQKKSLNQQKKLLEVYQKNFTEEGDPINAKVDVSKLAGLDLKEDNSLSMTADKIKQELESESFNSTDTSDWDFDDLSEPEK